MHRQVHLGEGNLAFFLGVEDYVSVLRIYRELCGRLLLLANLLLAGHRGRGRIPAVGGRRDGAETVVTRSRCASARHRGLRRGTAAQRRDTLV